MKNFVCFGLLIFPMIGFAASAIYHSPNSGAYYVNHNAVSAEQAKIKAYKLCTQDENTDCVFRTSSEYAGYGALAQNKNFIGVAYTTSAKSLQKAKLSALESCNQSFGNCKISLTWHDKVDGILPKQEEATCRNPSTGFAMVCGERVDTGGYVYGQKVNSYEYGYGYK